MCKWKGGQFDCNVTFMWYFITSPIICGNVFKIQHKSTLTHSFIIWSWALNYLYSITSKSSIKFSSKAYFDVHMRYSFVFFSVRHFIDYFLLILHYKRLKKILEMKWLWSQDDSWNIHSFYIWWDHSTRKYIYSLFKYVEDEGIKNIDKLLNYTVFTIVCRGELNNLIPPLLHFLDGSNNTLLSNNKSLEYPTNSSHTNRQNNKTNWMFLQGSWCYFNIVYLKLIYM